MHKESLSFSGGLLGLHFLDDFLELEGVQFAEIESEIHGLVAVLEGAEFCELNAMLVEFWMFLEMRLELGDLSVGLLASVDGTF